MKKVEKRRIFSCFCLELSKKVTKKVQFKNDANRILGCVFKEIRGFIKFNLYRHPFAQSSFAKSAFAKSLAKRALSNGNGVA